MQTSQDFLQRVHFERREYFWLLVLLLISKFVEAAWCSESLAVNSEFAVESVSTAANGIYSQRVIMNDVRMSYRENFCFVSLLAKCQRCHLSWEHVL
jgi:hypothetical protein